MLWFILFLGDPNPREDWYIACSNNGLLLPPRRWSVHAGDQILNKAGVKFVFIVLFAQ